MLVYLFALLIGILDFNCFAVYYGVCVLSGGFGLDDFCCFMLLLLLADFGCLLYGFVWVDTVVVLNVFLLC